MIRSGTDPKIAVASAYAQKRKAEKSTAPAAPIVEPNSEPEQLAQALTENTDATVEQAPKTIDTAAVSASTSLTDDMRAAILKKKQNRKFE